MIHKTLSESGDVSTVRVATLLVVAVVMGVWAYVSVAKLELQPISIEQLGALVTVLAAKVVQKGRENKTDGRV